MAKRIIKDKVNIDEDNLINFFNIRAEKYNAQNPYLSMLYQDNNPELAKHRDKYEKDLIVPLLKLSPNLSVLDIGCGVGRWADTLIDKIKHYHGIDLIENLIKIAQQRHVDNPNISFQVLKAQDLSPQVLNYPVLFDRIIIAGVFIYINDIDCISVLRHVLDCAADKCIIYLRDPIAIEERLTLNDIWSDELNSSYSAIYRTIDEYRKLFEEALLPSGFCIKESEILYKDDNYNNRHETKQHFFILERSR